MLSFSKGFGNAQKARITPHQKEIHSQAAGFSWYTSPSSIAKDCLAKPSPQLSFKMSQVSISIAAEIMAKLQLLIYRYLFEPLRFPKT